MATCVCGKPRVSGCEHLCLQCIMVYDGCCACRQINTNQTDQKQPQTKKIHKYTFNTVNGRPDHFPISFERGNNDKKINTVHINCPICMGYMIVYSKERATGNIKYPYREQLCTPDGKEFVCSTFVCNHIGRATFTSDKAIVMNALISNTNRRVELFGYDTKNFTDMELRNFIQKDSPQYPFVRDDQIPAHMHNRVYLDLFDEIPTTFVVVLNPDPSEVMHLCITEHN